MISASIAVIGAGLAGLACARRLAEAGLQPRVFESQRSPGGRLATRRFETASFDHGAQYLTVSDARFGRVIEAARVADAAARWSPRWQSDDRERGELWVGAPAMNSFPRFLAQDLDVEYGARIVRLERGRRGWTLVDDRGDGHVDFGFVVLALPAPAAAGLAALHSPLAERALAVRMAPCWAALFALDEPLEGAPDAGISVDPILPWFARNGSKPGRETSQSWVLHASAAWSHAAFDHPAARVQQALLERFSELIGRALPQPRLADSHRWRYARVEVPLGEPFLLDPEAGIAFCGDWCLGARAEAAFKSGDALGATLGGARRLAGSGKMRGSR